MTHDPEHIEPCRFCGHDGDGIQYALGDGTGLGKGQAQVACLMCGTHGPQADSISEARRLWNMPVPEFQEYLSARRAARYLRAG